MSQSTAFVLIPSASCAGSIYDKVISRLEAQGYAARAIDLASVVFSKDDTRRGGLYDDVKQARDAVSELAKQGKDVIVVGNSYGAFVGTEAAKGFGKRDGGPLVHLVYLASLLPEVGMSCDDLTEGLTPVTREPGQEFVDMPPNVIGMLASELSPEEQERYGAMVGFQCTKGFQERLTYAGHLHVPTTVVVTEKDLCLAPKIQHENVDRVLARGEGDIRKVSIQADHCAQITRPDEVVEILVKLARGE